MQCERAYLTRVPRYIAPPATRPARAAAPASSQQGGGSGTLMPHRGCDYACAAFNLPGLRGCTRVRERIHSRGGVYSASRATRVHGAQQLVSLRYKIVCWVNIEATLLLLLAKQQQQCWHVELQLQHPQLLPGSHQYACCHASPTQTGTVLDGMQIYTGIMLVLLHYGIRCVYK